MNPGTFGSLSEHLAALLLRLKGYRILARQLRTTRGIGAGEIDIVAKRGRTLAFVEVKARATTAQALEALSHQQRSRIQRAAIAYMSDHPRFAKFDMRFDLIAIAPWQIPNHIQNAW
jgi:putative endonuclease